MTMQPRKYRDLTSPATDHIIRQTTLDKAIAALPEKQSVAVVLRCHEDMYYEQICEILKISIKRG